MPGFHRKRHVQFTTTGVRGTMPAGRAVSFVARGKTVSAGEVLRAGRAMRRPKMVMEEFSLPTKTRRPRPKMVMQEFELPRRKRPKMAMEEYDLPSEKTRSFNSRMRQRRQL